MTAETESVETRDQSLRDVIIKGVCIIYNDLFIVNIHAGKSAKIAFGVESEVKGSVR